MLANERRQRRLDGVNWSVGESQPLIAERRTSPIHNRRVDLDQVARITLGPSGRLVAIFRSLAAACPSTLAVDATAAVLRPRGDTAGSRALRRDHGGAIARADEANGKDAAQECAINGEGWRHR